MLLVYISTAHLEFIRRPTQRHLLIIPDVTAILGVKPPRSRPGQGIDPDTTKDVTIDGFLNQSPGGGAACVAYVLGRPDCQRNPPLPACPSAHPSNFPEGIERLSPTVPDSSRQLHELIRTTFC